MIPWLVLRLREVYLGPGAGFPEHFGGVTAELTPTQEVWPKEVEEAWVFVAMVSKIYTGDASVTPSTWATRGRAMKRK